MQVDCCCQGLMLNVFDEAALTTETRQTVILAKCVCGTSLSDKHIVH